ncbi:hypothetical protein Tco_0953104 [Tanacetum coccineum]|uniref:Uncharacterized protein n=1 Tax=Tanacetum coccineum TaxID=301880 RepID=A0ABQ5DZW0_9ASTR
MAYTSSRSSSSSDNEVYDNSFCSKSCRKNTENLNNKIIKLNEELSDCETDLYNYKRGLPEFVDDTVTDYSRSTPSIDMPRDVSESVSFFEQRGSVGNVLSKPMISFVKETGCPSVSKVNNTEKYRKPTMKYAEMYRGGKMLKLMKITLVQMDAQTQGRHEHDQEFDAEITTVGAEVDDIAAET